MEKENLDIDTIRSNEKAFRFGKIIRLPVSIIFLMIIMKYENPYSIEKLFHYFIGIKNIFFILGLLSGIIICFLLYNLGKMITEDYIIPENSPNKWMPFWLYLVLTINLIWTGITYFDTYFSFLDFQSNDNLYFYFLGFFTIFLPLIFILTFFLAGPTDYPKKEDRKRVNQFLKEAEKNEKYRTGKYRTIFKKERINFRENKIKNTNRFITIMGKTQIEFKKQDFLSDNLNKNKILLNLIVVLGKIELKIPEDIKVICDNNLLNDGNKETKNNKDRQLLITTTKILGKINIKKID